MSYLVLARKYRPQAFDQVVKQAHVTQTLTNAISAGRVAHAILFSGPRGTGKTTVARILAKAMNCKTGSTPTPCNSCRSCREITSGRSVDVFEIDGASNNSVDQIRELRENVKYMPAHSRCKIYIIDEVHMLSIAAFNALLKTLEEPPSHVMFIFATTEPRKIPITILSRCQRHDFRLMDVESITRHMEMICKEEGVDIATESLGLIAREGVGSMRDALSLLDLVITCAAGQISHQQVLDILGLADRKIIFDISAAIFKGDISELFDILDEVYSNGHDMKKLSADLVEHFRNLLVVKMGNKINKLVDLPAHEIDLMVGQVKNVSAALLNQIFDMLFREAPLIGQSSQPKLAIEMVFIRLLQIKPALPIDVLIEKLDTLRKNIYKAQTADRDTTIESMTRGYPANAQASLNPEAGTAESTKSFETVSFEIDGNIDEIWDKLFLTFSEKHPSLAANLKDSTIKTLTDQRLEIEVRGNGFNIAMIRRAKNMDVINKICNDFFGKKMDVKIAVKENPNSDSRRKKGLTDRLKKEALSHPLVADAIEIFDGKVIDVKTS